MSGLSVLLLLHGWPAEEQGGTGLYVGALADALAAQGHRVSTLAPVPGDAGRRPRIVPLPARPDTEAWGIAQPAAQRFEDTWRRPDSDALLAGWLHHRAPDVVHVHHLAHGSFGWPAVARRGGAAVVMTLHDYLLPCARGQLVDRDLSPCPGPQPARCAACLGEHLHLDPLAAAARARLASLPAVAARGRALLREPPRDGALRTADRLAAARHLLRQPHRLLSPSRDLADRFTRFGLRTPTVFPLPLLREIAPAAPPPPGPVRFLFASSLIPTKGPHLLLEAFARLPPGAATLTLVGPAPPFDGAPDFHRRLAERAAETPGAELRDAVPADRIEALLHAHDVLVLPSTWPENSPLVVREADAAGLRLVVPQQGGAGELAPDARRVPGGDLDALTEALRQEVTQGRGRRVGGHWDRPATHAARLVREIYLPALQDRSGRLG